MATNDSQPAFLNLPTEDDRIDAADVKSARAIGFDQLSIPDNVELHVGMNLSELAIQSETELEPQSMAEETKDVRPLSERCLAEAPPWLTSVVTHLILFLILALLLVPKNSRTPFELNATLADRLGEQTDDLVMEIAPEMEAPEPTTDASDVEMPLVENPLFAPPELTMADSPTVQVVPVDAAALGIALSGREAGRKAALLKAFGGTAETEAAVQRALEWLVRNQRRNGHWSLQGPYKDGCASENKEAATGLALLAFEGAGNTTTTGRYQGEVEKAWTYLLKRQEADGCFFRSGDFNHRFYTHSICTLALCELVGMTRDPELKEPAQAAIDYLVELQNPQGGWRYDPGREADTSVTGWVLLALQSGQAAGLEVPSVVFQRISGYLDLAADYNGARYGYKPGQAESLSMTAEALLCRQYLGWQQKDQRLVSGVAYMRDHPILMRDPNIYYWYYATQVMHHMEGDAWEQWNRQMKATLPAAQVQHGREKGSWYFDNDRWGRMGGRMFTTCLSCYMLEVYYRHLPIYSPVFRFGQP